ncbi:MAG TPA: DUF305 domain-containing protein, partial [Gemmatimonadales bacterium]|nr:DUF305 domain-containing protein [Gemmatimonadales bacterium]
MRVLPSRFVPGAFLLFAAAACSKATNQGSGTAAQPAPNAENQAASAKPKGYPYTPADVEFMTGMIAHHAQALVMAGWAQSHGAEPSVQTLAGRIINGQQDEIATMQRWLKDRGQPVPDPAKPMQMSMHHTGQQGMLMPGRLTEAQMKELD